MIWLAPLGKFDDVYSDSSILCSRYNYVWFDLLLLFVYLFLILLKRCLFGWCKNPCVHQKQQKLLNRKCRLTQYLIVVLQKRVRKQGTSCETHFLNTLPAQQLGRGNNSVSRTACGPGQHSILNNRLDCRGAPRVILCDPC